MRIIYLLWPAVALSAATLGCAGGSKASGCAAAATEPCGGVIVPGTYTITASCADKIAAPFDSFCSGMEITMESANYSGATIFAADGTYRSTLTGDATQTITFPAACMTPADGEPGTCAQYGAWIKPPTDSAEVTTVACSGTDPCECDLTTRLNSKAETGSYSTSGNVLSLKYSANMSPRLVPYCVSPSGRQITEFPSEAGATAIVVLVRK
jgi:hypothetical protein